MAQQVHSLLKTLHRPNHVQFMKDITIAYENRLGIATKCDEKKEPRHSTKILPDMEHNRSFGCHEVKTSSIHNRY